MALISIVDPSIKDRAGHMLGQACALEAALMQAGYDVEIVGNRSLGEIDMLQDRRILRHFAVSQYHTPSRDLVAARRDNMAACVPGLVKDLAALAEDGVRQNFLLPTVNLPMLRAFVDWLAESGLQKDQSRSFHLFFYLECGVSLDDDDAPVVDDSLLAHEMRSAFADLAALKPVNVHLRAVSAEMAELYGIVAAAPMKCVMSYHEGGSPGSALPGERAAGVAPRILVYGGQAARGKGFLRVPELVRALSRVVPEADLVVQLHRFEGSPDIAAAAAEIRALAQSSSKLQILDGYLSDKDLDHLIAGSDVVVIGYDRRHYRGKTSGFLWDSVRSGSVPVVPAGTWLAREAQAFEAPVETYLGESAAEVADAVAKVVGDLPARRPKARAAAERFRSLTGPSALVRDHFRRLVPIRAPAAPRRTSLFDLTSIDFSTLISAPT
jgi:hypothetical protein